MLSGNPVVLPVDLRRQHDAPHARTGRRHRTGQSPGRLADNRQDGLPIEAACEAKPAAESTDADFQRRRTRSDDNAFRLSRMPIDACR